MRKALLFSFSVLLTFTAINTWAQAHADRFAYAITDINKDGQSWNALRKLDLQTGQYSTVLLNGSDLKAKVFDASTRKPLAVKPDPRYGDGLRAPFSTGVAAAAFDRKHNRLYFTPMFVDQLRYIDLSTMQLYYVTDQPFTNLGNLQHDEGKVITRMVIAPDGIGYAISNDGNMVIEFTTGKKIRITQLGPLVDDPSNEGISIHNRCSSFGGDMIADDQGNLYILTARNHVFKVATGTKIATHIGMINGLSKTFTVNGAVVDADGSLLVSSAVDATAYYVVNPKTWNAAPYTMTASVFRSSDLANSNYISLVKSSTLETVAPAQRPDNQIQVYPNPVTHNTFTVQFRDMPYGDYTLELMDALGRSVLQKRMTINVEGQTQNVNINSTVAPGVYMLQVIDRQKKKLFEQKLIVQ